MTTITDPEALPSADGTEIPGELHTVPHWKAGTSLAGESTRTSDVFDPATGRITKRLALASTGGRRRDHRGGAGGLAGLAGHVPGPPHADPVPVP